MLFLYYGGWGFMILSLIISLSATAFVKYTFSKYSKENNSRYLTGAQIARQILDANGLYNVEIIHTAGSLTDYYNPSENVVALSDSVYSSSSISAAGVAAHECGHAIQYAKDYAPIKLRNKIIPYTQFGSKFWYISILLGMFFGNSWAGNLFLFIGIALFCLICFFQLATLPVEFNASQRAVKILESNYILTTDETKKASRVLKAAAMTYVAALITSILQLIRLLGMAKNRRRN